MSEAWELAGFGLSEEMAEKCADLFCYPSKILAQQRSKTRGRESTIQHVSTNDTTTKSSHSPHDPSKVLSPVRFSLKLAMFDLVTIPLYVTVC